VQPGLQTESPPCKSTNRGLPYASFCRRLPCSSASPPPALSLSRIVASLHRSTCAGPPARERACVPPLLVLVSASSTGTRSRRHPLLPRLPALHALGPATSPAACARSSATWPGALPAINPGPCVACLASPCDRGAMPLRMASRGQQNRSPPPQCLPSPRDAALGD